ALSKHFCRRRFVAGRRWTVWRAGLQCGATHTRGWHPDGAGRTDRRRDAAGPGPRPGAGSGGRRNWDSPCAGHRAGLARPKLQLRFRTLFQKRKLDAEMEEELRSHIEMQTQENIGAGMDPKEARYAALRQFGWVESIKQTCREQRGVNWIEHLIQDFRYGLR